MKARKALKRLAHVDDLLSSVLIQYAGKKPALQELLHSAKTAVSRAQKTIEPQAKSAKAKGKAPRPQTQVEQPKPPETRRPVAKKVAAAKPKSHPAAKRTAAVKKAARPSAHAGKAARNQRRAAPKKLAAPRTRGPVLPSQAAVAKGAPKEPTRSPAAAPVAERSSAVSAAPENQSLPATPGAMK